YQSIPFQWSCHVEDGEGNVEHGEFLYLRDEEVEEERMEQLSVENVTWKFVENLVEYMEGAGLEEGRDRIFIYSKYEVTTLNKAKEVLGNSEVAERREILPKIDWVVGFFVDMLEIVKKNYYHFGMKGSMGLKSLHKVLCAKKEEQYDDL